MSAMFKISITEGWLDIMWVAVDSRGEDQLGERDSNPFQSIFFVCFILIGAWFILNIFDNITIDQYLKEKDKELNIDKFNQD